MAFRSFQGRILVLFLGLITAVLLLTLILVDAANTRNARTQIDDALEVGAGVFRQLVADRRERMLEAARLLSSDFAFKRAYATGDRGTVVSALQNSRQRIGADAMLVSDLDYAVFADATGIGSAGAELPFAGRIEDALEDGVTESSTIVPIQGVPHLMMAVPLLMPQPAAWICVGFRIDDDFARDFQRLTLSHVTMLSRTNGGAWEGFASTLPEGRTSALERRLASRDGVMDRSVPIELDGETLVSLVTTLQRTDGEIVVAVLQRSLDEALAPYLRLRWMLLGLFLSGLTLAALLGVRIARSVSRPVLEIAAAAQKVEQGDYSPRLHLTRRDELGRLGESFNHMVAGLKERERVRDLLGKVVSPEIARELLSKEIELGGEEREITILFSDLRDFTGLCEGAAPGAILERLNVYLTRMGQVIEAHGGVIDKFVGDAIMALFGAPLSHADDPSRAVRAAVAMQSALTALNLELRAAGASELQMGIGVNTATVVVGNMGSRTRMNYTVIGDGVNVAARLETLTKRYDTGILVSESTRIAAADLNYREVDVVQVKGKSEPIRVFTVI